MMTLDEAIIHIRNDILIKSTENNCKECYEEHKQLLLWLEELKKYRELCMDDGK